MRFLFLLLISFSAYAEESRKLMELEPRIFNGQRSIQGEFLPMGWIQNCTGTAVAKNVIFTASHCVTTGKRIKFDSRFDGKSYYAVCSRHPKYNTRTVYNDYALCKLEGEFPADMPLASFEARTPEIGEDLLLNGYGAPNVGTHHWGKEAMDRVSGQDLVACGRVYLGGGDSGGSLLAWTEDRSGKSGFKILGVNSRGGGNCSYFNRISAPEWNSWAKEYEAEKGVKLCGVSQQCTGSTPPPPPPPPPQPVDCWKVYEEFAFCLGTKSLPGCLLKADQLKQCVR